MSLQGRCTASYGMTRVSMFLYLFFFVLKYVQIQNAKYVEYVDVLAAQPRMGATFECTGAKNWAETSVTLVPMLRDLTPLFDSRLSALSNLMVCPMFAPPRRLRNAL